MDHFYGGRPIDQRDSLVIPVLFPRVFPISDDGTACTGVYVLPLYPTYFALAQTCSNGKFDNPCNRNVGIGEIFKIVHEAVEFMLSGAAVSFVGASD